MNRLQDVAVDAAKAAGRLLLEGPDDLRSLKFKEVVGDTSDSRKHYVTEMDRRCEDLIKQRLVREFPQFGILGEEESAENLSAEFIWVVDPLDGTLSYSHGLSSYTISIALLHKQNPILGIVYGPVQDELFVAEKGKGAVLNGISIQVSPERTIENALVSMDHRIFRTQEYPRATTDLVKRIKRLRVSESCSQELCYVACGRIDAFIRTLQPTPDYVAAKIIVEEAQGIIRDFDDGFITPTINLVRNTNLLAGNLKLVRNLLPFLQR